MKRTYHQVAIFILLFFTTLLGFYLRIVTLSPFKFYPDAYQSLIVVRNISTYHSVIGTLGPNGMVYPDFFMWTHPMYPLLINLTNLFVHNDVFSAQLVAMVMGVLTIPLVFFLLRRLFKNTYISLLGSLLLALSFLHTVWSGYIMTETTGVFFVSVTIFFLFHTHEKTAAIDIQDALAGASLGCAVLTRYEYAILLFPIAISLWRGRDTFLSRFISFYIAFAFIISIAAGLLFPFPETIRVVWEQTQSLLIQISIFSIIALCIIGAYFFLPHQRKKQISKIAVKFLPVILVFFYAESIVLVPAFRKLALYDSLITLFSFVGMILLLRQQKFLRVIVFCFFSIAVLGLLYKKINPDMERYMTHLLPFLILPASYGLWQIFGFIQTNFSSISIRNRGVGIVAGSFLIVLLVRQIMVTYDGIRYWDSGAWQQVSYEEASAKHVKKVIHEHDALVLASFPEPYYLFTNLSTYSVADTYPYIYIDTSLMQKNIYVVDDMGMHDIFPRFSRFLKNNLGKNKYKMYVVKQAYHYGTKTLRENSPVIVYKIKVSELVKTISKNKI